MATSPAVRNLPHAFTDVDSTGASEDETWLEAAVGPGGQLFAVLSLYEALPTQGIELRGASAATIGGDLRQVNADVRLRTPGGAGAPGARLRPA